MQSNSETVNINDLFWTFQGEGFYAGTRSLFVRMPFCNLSCEWCDTYFSTFTKTTFDHFKNFATSEPARFAVLTGGEPMLNKHSPIVISWLRGLGFKVACESNGTVPILPGIDFATVSPKRQSAEKGLEPYYIHPDAFDRASEFKYVVDSQFDWKVLNRHKPTSSPRLSLSPEFGNFKESIEKISEYISLNPMWVMSLQTHKWIGVK